MNIFTHKPADPTAPITPVVTVEKACLWVKTDPDDAEVPDLLADVMEEVEKHCRQPIYSRDFIVVCRGFESGHFASLYVSAIVEVKYRIEGATTLETLDETEYELWENAIVFRASAFELENVDRVEIRFTAGFDPIPGAIRQAIRFMLADWYDNRADGKRTVPTASQNLLSHYVLPLA